MHNTHRVKNISPLREILQSYGAILWCNLMCAILYVQSYGNLILFTKFTCGLERHAVPHRLYVMPPSVKKTRGLK